LTCPELSSAEIVTDLVPPGFAYALPMGVTQTKGAAPSEYVRVEFFTFLKTKVTDFVPFGTDVTVVNPSTTQVASNEGFLAWAKLIDENNMQRVATAVKNLNDDNFIIYSFLNAINNFTLTQRLDLKLSRVKEASSLKSSNKTPTTVFQQYGSG
jgi:hypothetical protein